MNKSTIFIFTRNSEIAAATRYRFSQYISSFAKDNLKVKIIPLISNASFRLSKSSRAPIFYMLLSYCKRAWQLIKLPRKSLLIIYSELFPYIPSIIELSILKLKSYNFIYDIDDAFHIQYSESKSVFVRFLLKNKIQSLITHAKHVTTGNNILMNLAQIYNKKCTLLPTVVWLSQYDLIHKPESHAKKFDIGWIGSPTTGPFLNILYAPLVRLREKQKISVAICGARMNHNIPDTEEIEWKLDREIDTIKSFNIGIMPLPDTLWTRGKSGFKIIQYMACSIPVVASPVGFNKDIIKHGINGYLAETEDQWVEYVGQLLNDENLRIQIGKEGRNTCEEWLSAEKQYQNFINIIKNL